MIGRKFFVVLLAGFALSACSIRLSKPASSGYAEVASAIRPNGKPAILLKYVETSWGLLEVDLNSDNVPHTTTIYLRPGMYRAELACQFIATVKNKDNGRIFNDVYYAEPKPEDGPFKFSVEADKKYTLDCGDSIQDIQFTLTENQ